MNAAHPTAQATALPNPRVLAQIPLDELKRELAAAEAHAKGMQRAAALAQAKADQLRKEVRRRKRAAAGERIERRTPCP